MFRKAYFVTFLLVKFGFETNDGPLMEPYIKKYFSEVSEAQSAKNYFKVTVLQGEESSSFEEIQALAPTLPRGWYELARLKKEDRVEFTRDFWISKLPYHPETQAKLVQFFKGVEDIGIVIAERHFDDPFEAHMIYSLTEGRGFFHGAVPLSEANALELKTLVSDVLLPKDYIAFLEIHDGFSKSTDTGVIASARMKESLGRFIKLATREPLLLTTKGKAVNPLSLIPFYESFGMPFYQCFWKDWYPEHEMGNVYYSGVQNSLSDPEDQLFSGDAMAFPTFLEWLFFYLERLV